MQSNDVIYLATVCIEPNRWGSRQPSFCVSDWLDRITADGFDGVELWEFHYTGADEQERQRLIERRAAVPLYNTYATFGDSPEEADHRAAAAEAIENLDASGVKYNIGRDAEQMGTFRKNLLAWADQVPDSCRLLCECHPGTLLEKVDDAMAFFADLDPNRFAVIAHLDNDAQSLENWVEKFGDRLQHLHMQRRTAEHDPTTPSGRKSLADCVAALTRHDYHGSLSVEFTRGIGRDEDIETVYANAAADRAAYLEAKS